MSMPAATDDAARFARTLFDALVAGGWTPGRSAYRCHCLITGLDAGPLTARSAALRLPCRAGLKVIGSRCEDPVAAALHVAGQIQTARREHLRDLRRRQEDAHDPAL